MFKWQGVRVEVDAANFPLLSLFRRGENRDGGTCNSDALHSYCSTLNPCHCSKKLT